MLVRSKLSNFSVSYIKNTAVDIIKTYFSGLSLGDPVDTAELSSQVAAIQGVKEFFLEDANGKTNSHLQFYSWNPLYSNEDHVVSTQTLQVNPFVFCYFYDINNIQNIIEVRTEQ